MAAAIAEKKAERMKSTKKAAASAAAAAAAAATAARSRAQAGASIGGRTVDESNATTPAFGPRYGDPQSRLGHKRSPSKTTDADTGTSTLGGGTTATISEQEGTAEFKGATVVLSSDKPG